MNTCTDLQTLIEKKNTSKKVEKCRNQVNKKLISLEKKRMSD